MSVVLTTGLAAVGVGTALLPAAPSRLSRPAGPNLSWGRLERPEIAGAAGGLVGLALGPAGAALGALLGWLALRAVVRRREAQAKAVEQAGLAESLGGLAEELRSGRPPGSALEAVVPAAGPVAQRVLRAAATTQLTGGDAAEVLLAAEFDELVRLGICWRVCGGSGAGLASSVQALHESVRAARARQLLVDGELAGPRATALMLAGLPLAGLALAAGLGAHPLHVLFRTPVGVGCLAAGVGLDLLGVWWTGRIVAGAAGP